MNGRLYNKRNVNSYLASTSVHATVKEQNVERATVADTAKYRLNMLAMTSVASTEFASRCREKVNVKHL